MTVTRRIAGHWLRGCRCRAANQRGNYECCRILHSGLFISLCHYRVEHKKLLTPSRPERHDHKASSLPAAINRPLTFFPLGENAKGSLAKNHQKQGLNYENLQIVHCIRARLLCAFTRSASSRPAARWWLSQLHHCGGRPRPSGSHLRRWEHSNWYVFVV